MAKVGPTEFAKIVGATRQAIHNHLGKMHGAKKIKGKWEIDVEVATRWINENARKLSRRQAVSVRPPKAMVTAATAVSVPRTGDALVDHVNDMRGIVDSMIACLKDGQISPQVTTMLKQCSSELRELIQLRRKEREADVQVMPREQHRQTMATLVKLIDQEGKSLAAVMPGAMVTALADAGIKIDDHKRATVILGEAVREQWSRATGRMAHFIRNARKSS